MKKSNILLAIIVASLSFFFLVNLVEAVELEPPIKHKTFEELIDAIINFLMQLALVVAPITIIIAGFYFITAAGDPAKIDTGKKIILYTVIGLFIVLLSRGIIALFKEIFKTQG